MERAICTIITRSYLSYARTLAETLYRHNPEYKLYVLITESVDEYFETKTEPFTCIFLEDLSDINVIQKMCFYYTSFELCNGLRGFLHEYMLNKTSHQNWLYLDADIAVYASLEPIFEELQETSILLIPHSQKPAPKRYVELYELNHIIEGIYNSGFLGLRRTETTRNFIEWFKERLSQYAFDDRSLGIPRALFGDQPWLNLVPLYFSETSLFKSSGANLAHWNLYRNHLIKDEAGEVRVNSEKLLFIHFSGFEIGKPEKVSKYSPLYNEENTSDIWIDLAREYQSLLYKNGYIETINFPYKYDYFTSREKIDFSMRRIYYDDLQYNYCSGNPFNKYEYFKKRTRFEQRKRIFNLSKKLLLRNKVIKWKFLK